MIRIIRLILLFSILFSTLVFVECSSRVNIAVTDADSTTSILPKDSSGISANISLGRKVSHKTGELIGKGQTFTSMPKEDVVAYIELKNRLLHLDKEQLFHVYWLHENGKSIYKKQITLAGGDSSSTIISSISISPEKRKPGKYILKLYYFRELIAEKQFEILPAFFKEQLGDEIPEITFYRKSDRKTGKLIGVDSVFILNKKHKVRAFVDLKNRALYGNRELMFHFNWLGPDGVTVFSKHKSIMAGDSVSFIRSSISIAPEKLKAGEYKLQLFLFNKLISEKKFRLKEKPKLIKKRKSYDISADITLCRKISKKTGKAIGEASVFTIADKARLSALIKIKGIEKYPNKEFKFSLKWINPEGKTFFKKQIDNVTEKSDAEIKSSISIKPGKRTPGLYTFQVFLIDKLIGTKSFELVEN